MSLFDFLNKAQEKVEALQKKAETIATQFEKGQTAAIMEMMKQRANQPVAKVQQPKKARPNLLAKRIVALFYADYPETPYISNDRRPDWLEMAATFPKTALVQRNMMVRFDDGLLPGHIYMLYWLNRYTNKKVPAYFEFKYGIHFDSEKLFLRNSGYLNDIDKPTEKGNTAIQKHIEVIDNHSPKPDRSIEGISKQILAQRDSLLRNGFKEYEFMANSDCCNLCAGLNGKHFPISKLKIGVNAPPIHEGCRCAIAAYEDDTEYEAWLRSL